jgi:vacuolar-type H+-ATPase subunit I/STV1
VFAHPFSRLGLGLLAVALIAWLVSLAVASSVLDRIAIIAAIAGVIALIIGVVVSAMDGPRGPRTGI